jgi:hypothetical protein
VDVLKDKHIGYTNKSGKNMESLEQDIETHKFRIDEMSKILAKKDTPPAELNLVTRKIKDELRDKQQAEAALKEILQYKPDQR